MDESRAPRAPADDRADLRAFAGADETALAPLVRSLFTAIYWRCRRRLADSEEAKDVAQETLLRVVRYLPALDDACPFRRWVNSVARRVCLDSVRRQRSAARLPVFPPLPDPEPVERVLEAEDRRLAVLALRALNSRHREALVRAEVIGQSHTEIARAMGTTPGAVKALLYRARTGLRRSYAVLAS